MTVVVLRWQMMTLAESLVSGGRFAMTVLTVG